MTETSATTFQLAGAACFGAVVGWFLYFLNRYRTDVRLADLGTLVAAIGAGSVLTLFPAKTDMFAAYAIGLATGFFTYFVVLVIMIAISKESTVEVFIHPTAGNRPMEAPDVLDRAMDASNGLDADHIDKAAGVVEKAASEPKPANASTAAADNAMEAGNGLDAD